MLWLCKALVEEQRRCGVTGSLTEIGVHHGRFFIGLHLLSAPSEKSLAIDLFDDQATNIDSSGKGDKATFLRNLQRFGGGDEGLQILACDSTNLTGVDVLDRVGPVRLFSVDGGHTAEIVASDMHLAAEVLTDGGIVIGDDVFNDQWPGVAEGTLRFLDSSSDLVPFAIGFNKVLFTNPPHADAYREVTTSFARRRLWEKKESTMHGSPVAVVWRSRLSRKHRLLAKRLLNR